MENVIIYVQYNIFFLYLKGLPRNLCALGQKLLPYAVVKPDLRKGLLYLPDAHFLFLQGALQAQRAFYIVFQPFQAANVAGIQRFPILGRLAASGGIAPQERAEKRKIQPAFRSLSGKPGPCP